MATLGILELGSVVGVEVSCWWGWIAPDRDVRVAEVERSRLPPRRVEGIPLVVVKKFF